MISRDEATAAHAAIGIELKGLHEYAAFALSPEARSAVDAALAEYAEREAALATHVAAWDALLASDAALVADGYPTLPVVPTSQAVLDELAADRAALETASDNFELEPIASQVNVTFGQPQPKE